MQILVVNQVEVEALLSMEACMALMERALAALAAGAALAPLRSIMWLPGRLGALGTMPAYVDWLGTFGAKIISVFPGNYGTEFDAHQGAVVLFEATHGRPVAFVDATAVTAIRTAAVSGVATEHLAREDAGDLALLGSGTQARTHLEAMRVARPLRRVRVWSRTQAHAVRFARAEGSRWNLPIEVAPTARDAVEDADLICTTTAAAEPILHGEWISPGAHINAVGSSVPSARELDAVAVARSRLFVDRRESALREAGDFLLARGEGRIGDDHICGEIGEVILGRVPGRTAPGEITLFKSVGLGIEDVAAAHHVYTRALETGAGVRVTLGGGHGERNVGRK
ncbi:MAG: ornithine cyclodeaminase family protein [Armatimonadota bacterium]|nr:ornithine cyclodeaminase family protein [Armatimonadota bacterium]